MDRPNYQMKVGSYTGNGSYQHVSSVGFMPDLVFAIPASANGTAIKDKHGLDIQSQTWSGTEDAGGTLIRGLTSSGFTVSNGVVNSSGVSYYYVAFRGTTDVIGTGLYIGTGVAWDIVAPDRMNFTPKFLFLRPMATIGQLFHCSDIHTSTQSQQFSSIALTASGNLTGMLANGFGLSTNTGANQNGTGYRYFTITDQIPRTAFKAGTYTGTGAEQTISGVGFKPDFLFIKSTTTTAGSESPSLYVSSFPSGQAKRTNAVALTTDIITSTHSDGFTVGTNAGVSESGDTFQYVAFKAGDFIVPVTRNDVTYG